MNYMQAVFSISRDNGPEVLGRSSDDLDVAVDNMSGEQFAEKATEGGSFATDSSFSDDGDFASKER